MCVCVLQHVLCVGVLIGVGKCEGIHTYYVRMYTSNRKQQILQSHYLHKGGGGGLQGCGVNMCVFLIGTIKF